jgi:hypothetical protein
MSDAPLFDSVTANGSVLLYTSKKGEQAFRTGQRGNVTLMTRATPVPQRLTAAGKDPI